MKIVLFAMLAMAGIKTFYAETVMERHGSSKIRGRFVLDGATCAGFEFFSDKEIIWRNEITCSEPDTMLVHWLDEKSFLVKDKRRVNVNKECPPRNLYYVVSRYDGKSLALQEVWTGWGDFTKETLKFSKQLP
ncbi:hypothetical protein [Dyadobacter sp. CY323]|uniref:hypothetical protein n=1 Tax=Dyadobacter sp. CY323 TaxID=2907302 RepID=UPI001F36BA99|nr:hypothetical protein [Dyadobacter sp. CY323]MCE6987613.1 hypothetical protein [Dyadobacter sp. CY323]